MQLAIRGKDASAVDRVFIALQRTDEPARFLDDQRTGGDVPWLNRTFPISFISPGGNIGHVQRGGTHAADAGDLVLHDRLKFVHEFLSSGLGAAPLSGNSRGKNGILKIGAIGYAQALIP